MTLYVVRHAIAEDLPRSPPSADRERALTGAGKRRMWRAAAGLRAIGAVPSRIVTSPLRRARETAEILAEAFGGIGIEQLDELGPGHEPPAAIRVLARYHDRSPLAVVGHEPGLGRLTSLLLTGSPSACPFRFRKGGVACLELDTPRPGAAVLEWFLTPKQLRRLGGNDT